MEPTAGQRLRREGERPPDTVENLIVIGASMGGQDVIEQVIRGLSDDIPAAIIIMVHSAAKHVVASATHQFHLN